MHMYCKRRYFRHILKKSPVRYINICALYMSLNMEELKEFNAFSLPQSKKARQAANQICAVREEGVAA